jgi:hypothetical protein
MVIMGICDLATMHGEKCDKIAVAFSLILNHGGHGMMVSVWLVAM